MKLDKGCTDFKKTAVVTIDIQMDYFPGGAFPLFRANAALKKTKALLDWARSNGLPVLHVHHTTLRPGARFLRPGTAGLDLHPGLGILPTEKIIYKHFSNSFRETSLEADLREAGIEQVIWAGMISWMCVDTTVRAAFDLKFKNIVIADATASGPLKKIGGLLETVSGGKLNGIVAPWTAQKAFVAGLGALHARVVNLHRL